MNPPGNGAVPAVLPGGIRTAANASSSVGAFAAGSRAGVGSLFAAGPLAETGPRSPALIAVAHGSRDPRSAATMYAVVEQIAAARPDLDVHLAFLDLNAPSVDQVVDSVAAEGHSHAVVVPLLLGSAFHARVDLPGMLDEIRARHPRLRLTQADVLGADPRLITALRDRVMDMLGDPVRIAVESTAPEQVRLPGGPSAPAASTPAISPARRIGIAVAAVGSSSAAANIRTAEVARALTDLTGWDAETCFATTNPNLPEAISALRARGAEQVIVAPWFLAPGLLTDRLIAAAPDVTHAPTLGAHPHLSEVVLDRYLAAAIAPLRLSA